MKKMLEKKARIKQRKIRYFGHIIRADEIQKSIIDMKVEGQRGRGDVGEHGLMISSSGYKGA